MKLPFCVVPLDFSVTGYSSTMPGTPADNITAFDTIGMVWRTNDETAELYVDFGSPKVIDFVAMLATNAEPPTTWQVLLGSDPTIATILYNSGTIPFITPATTRANALYNSHLELDTPITARYMKVQVNQPAGSTWIVPFLIAGKKITPATFYSAGFEYGVEDLGSLDISPNGVVEETTGRIMRSLDFQLGWETAADFETKWRPLIETLGKRRPSYWCFDPEATTARQAKTYFGWLKQPPAARVGEVPGKVKQDFSIRSMI